MRYVAKNWPAWALRRRKRPVELPQFGPPTLVEYQAAQLFRRAAECFMEQSAEQKTQIAFLSGEQWPKDISVRIRLPNDYVARVA